MPSFATNRKKMKLRTANSAGCYSGEDRLEAARAATALKLRVGAHIRTISGLNSHLVSWGGKWEAAPECPAVIEVTCSSWLIWKKVYQLQRFLTSAFARGGVNRLPQQSQTYSRRFANPYHARKHVCVQIITRRRANKSNCPPKR